uniref:F-box domain-containing protein n=1 Tax=Chrysotila carterae TaxID=13221 RepID=A0A7S4AYE1_CHRCT
MPRSTKPLQFQQLPFEVLGLIAAHLPTLDDLFALAAVCRMLVSLLRIDSVWRAAYLKTSPHWQTCGLSLPGYLSDNWISYHNLAVATRSTCAMCASMDVNAMTPRIQRWSRQDAVHARERLKKLLHPSAAELTIIRAHSVDNCVLVATWISAHSLDDIAVNASSTGDCAGNVANFNGMRTQAKMRRWIRRSSISNWEGERQQVFQCAAEAVDLMNNRRVEDWTALCVSECQRSAGDSDNASTSNVHAAADHTLAAPVDRQEPSTACSGEALTWGLQDADWSRIEQWSADCMRHNGFGEILLPRLQTCTLSARLELLARTAAIALRWWVGRGNCMFIFEVRGGLPQRVLLVDRLSKSLLPLP